MSSQRTAWHFFFTILLRKRGPSEFDVRDEVPLSEEPPRLDYLLLRKRIEAAAQRPAETLRALWPRLPLVTVAEFKSIGRPYRTRNLDRLWGYIHLYFSDSKSGIRQRDELCGLLIVTTRSPALDADANSMGLLWNDLGGGYWELRGGLFRLYVVELDRVAEYEDDDLLRLFGHAKERTLEARRFWAEQMGTKEAMMALHELEGYDEVVQKFLELIPPEQRLAGLAPEEAVLALHKLEGYDEVVQKFLELIPPEQRLAGLAPEEAVLALPDEVLRALSDDFIEKLPESVQATIRRRLGR
ncbi:MAG: hypothetical protein L6Q76_01540 [Polyangiaceae bacterium]|nr:hypothetical protein [Polyangiaceae bacterium]